QQAPARPAHRGVSSMAEQWAFNPLVQGSTPWRPTRENISNRWLGVARDDPMEAAGSPGVAVAGAAASLAPFRAEALRARRLRARLPCHAAGLWVASPARRGHGQRAAAPQGGDPPVVTRTRAPKCPRLFMCGREPPLGAIRTNDL